MYLMRAGPLNNWLKSCIPRLSSAPEPTPVSALPVPQPTPSRESEKLIWRKADVHARALVALVYEGSQPVAPGLVLARDLQLIYRDMLMELNWGERSWQTVGCAVRKALRQPKTYTWWEDEDGVSHRLRCYVFPKSLPAAITPADVALVSESCSGNSNDGLDCAQAA